MTAGYADLGDGKLYYEIEGEGEPLVLCHAGFVDSRMWDGQWKAFTQHYRVLRFDMRGFGKSDPVNGPVSRRRDLYCMLRKLGIERANLLGCSMGGEMVIDFALEHPEKCCRWLSSAALRAALKCKARRHPRFWRCCRRLSRVTLSV